MQTTLNLFLVRTKSYCTHFNVSQGKLLSYWHIPKNEEFWCSVLAICNLITFCSSDIRHKIDLELVAGRIKMLVCLKMPGRKQALRSGVLWLRVIISGTKYSSPIQPIHIAVQDRLVLWMDPLPDRTKYRSWENYYFCLFSKPRSLEKTSVASWQEGLPLQKADVRSEAQVMVGISGLQGT